MFEIVSANYKTYRNEGYGEPESHRVRLLVFISTAASLSLLSDFPSTDTFALLVTFLSVLTGFVFTALFSDHALADAGLPMPCDETDRIDLRRLKALGINLTSRANFFIVAAILCCASVVIANFDFSWLKSEIVELLTPFDSVDFRILEFAKSISSKIPVFFFFVVLTLAFEAAYTFYRLAETMLAVLAIRRQYLSARR